MTYLYDDVMKISSRYGYLNHATQEQLEKLLLFTLRDNSKLQDIVVIVWICSGDVRYEDVLHHFMSYFHPVKSDEVPDTCY